MGKITHISLLALCAFVLPTYGLQSGTQLGNSASAASGSQSSALHWLPGKKPGFPGKRCPFGQVYKKCASSTCGEYRCKDLYHFRQRACTADCQSRCFCSWPFFRNNDGRCVPVWQCYTYKAPAWFGNRRPGATGQMAGGQYGTSGSATASGNVGASSGTQSGNWGAASGAHSGSSSSVNGQWAGGVGQATGQPTSSWVSGPVSQLGGWGSMNGAQAGSWNYGPGQYTGTWGVVTPQYAGAWGLNNGGW